MSIAEFGDLALATMEEYLPAFVDAIHNGSPTIAFLKEKGRVKPRPIGQAVIVPVLAKEANEPEFYRYADSMTFAPQDTHEAARFRPANLRQGITISEEELMENETEQQRFDLLQMKIQAAEATFRTRYNQSIVLNKSCYVALYGGNSVNLPDTIPAIFGQSVGSATNGLYKTYGEIARSTVTVSAPWWRANATPYGAAGTLSTCLDSAYFAAARDGQTIDLVLTNTPGYRAIAKMLRAQGGIRYNLDVQGGRPPQYKGGYTGLMYQGADVRWDPAVKGNIGDGASNHAVYFMLNTDYTHLWEDSRQSFALSPFEAPRGSDTQEVRRGKVLHRYTFFNNNPNLNAVVYDGSTAAGTT